MSGDTIRALDAVLALAGVLTVGFGLAQGWAGFIVWKWVTAAFLTLLVVLAIVLVDAAGDPTLPNYSNGAPLRLWALTVALALVALTGAVATWFTWRHPSSRPAQH